MYQDVRHYQASGDFHDCEVTRRRAASGVRAELDDVPAGAAEECLAERRQDVQRAEASGKSANRRN